jgi:uncharacterized membrane protein
MDQTENTGGTETATPVTPTPAPVTAPSEPKLAFDQKDVEENKLVAALSYLGLLFLVPLLVKKDSPFAQFHAKQGLVLCIAFFIGSFFFGIPFLGWAAGVFLVVVDIMALVKTLGGETWEIPVVKDIVKKLNI